MVKKSIDEQLVEEFFNMTRILKHHSVFDEASINLTVSQFHILLYIKEHKKAQISDIAQVFKTTLPTATVNIDKLVSLGYIEKKQDKDDRRIVHVDFTELGNTLLTKAKATRGKQVKDLLSKLIQKDKEELLRIMQLLTS
jgi:DNA-binding MarR family transcriptional regulator